MWLTSHFCHSSSCWYCVIMEMWTIFFCVLFLSGVSGDCSTHLNITAPSTVTTLAGSCVKIPCTYKPNPSSFELGNQNVFAVWIKGLVQFEQKPQNIIFNSSGTSGYDGTIEGNLTDLNCTTVFKNFQTNQTDKYFFRIERDPFKATANCNPVNIKVIDSPPSPTFSISPSDSQLREAQSVTLTCSAPTYCLESPPRLTWTLQGQYTSHQVQKHETSIHTTFDLTDKHDGLRVTCSAGYSVNDGSEKLAESNVTLNVSYAPKETSVSVSPSDGLSPGNQVNLTCSSRAKPTVSQFVWLKRSPDGTQTEIKGPVLYNIILAEGEVYVCIAVHDFGNQTSAEIRVTGGPLEWTVIVGAVFGFVALVGLIAFISFWCLKTKAQNQNEARAELTAQKDEENIHYGEINFSIFKSNTSSPSSHTLQDSEQQEDTVYAQVNKTKTPDS
ncbi:B-cell receptor CD22-like isoform X2 [Cynoglossus semilaevis]|uniref:B-cell receptor CD22-like isoform X2 n=1 Tax=Cynoglossus semilaevis TaxID=244447 RepID=UPI0004952F38|nr:B-cell receptor CD22-like isoform X2 [Cynoglossus semilaevis]